MPYTREHKARTRARIVDSARRLFNHRGFDQISIDQVMAQAGLTRGGFYNHFRSKAELYAATVASYATCNPFAVEMAGRKPQLTDAGELARKLVELYLGDEVFNDVDQHCPLYALPSDVARAGLKPRRAYTDLIRGMAGIFRSALGNAPEAERRANILVSLCVGGMVLARTTHDPELRSSLRAVALDHALSLLSV